MYVSTIMALAFVAITQDEASKTNLDWTWDRDSPLCTLVQEVRGDGAKLVISRTPGNSGTSVSVYTRGKSLSGSFVKDINVILEPGGQTAADGYVGFDPGNPARKVVSVALEDQTFLDRLSQASALTFDGKKVGRRRVAIRHAAAAAQALRRCEDAKMRSWGIDPGAWRFLRSRPVPSKQANVLTPADYPTDQMRDGLSGKVVVRLSVGADGAVKDCVSVLPRSSPSFASAVCNAYTKRAKFTPAQDSTGRPVEAEYVISVNFVMAGW